MHLLERFQLTYCTNIHPGRDWDETFAHLCTHVPGVKAALQPNGDFGLGLRLSGLAARELLEPGRLPAFKQWLSSAGVYVFTINGFPYGSFHGEPVKDQVHAPDWTHPERVTYTRHLAHILAELLPPGLAGGISTSPVSYRHWQSDREQVRETMLRAAQHYCEVAEFLEELENERSVHIHLDIEPEPDGLLENSEDMISFFEDYLRPIARQRAREQGEPADRGEARVRRYLCLCYDVCHYALAFEEPTDSFRRMKQHGIRIGKVQLSAALALRKDDLIPGDDPWALMAQLHEPTYLHQVTVNGQGGLNTIPDIPELLSSKPDFLELRAHFHVPVFCERFGLLRSTSDQIVRVLEYLREQPDCEHLEVETYTWEVLPGELKIPLAESIARELVWCRDRLLAHANNE